MIKATRRGLFRGVFRRTRFELRLETANDVLMRINRSLDPQMITDDLWSTYVALRRSLGYAPPSQAELPSGRERPALPSDPQIQDAVGRLPPSVVKDFTLLLRIEARLRLALTDSVERGPSIRADLRDEIRDYLGPNMESLSSGEDGIEPAVRCLTEAAGLDMDAVTT